jgi:hypothetical protein
MLPWQFYTIDDRVKGQQLNLNSNFKFNCLFTLESNHKFRIKDKAQTWDRQGDKLLSDQTCCAFGRTKYWWNCDW